VGIASRWNEWLAKAFRTVADYWALKDSAGRKDFLMNKDNGLVLMALANDTIKDGEWTALGRSLRVVDELEFDCVGDVALDDIAVQQTVASGVEAGGEQKAATTASATTPATTPPATLTAGIAARVRFGEIKKRGSGYLIRKGISQLFLRFRLVARVIEIGCGMVAVCYFHCIIFHGGHAPLVPANDVNRRVDELYSAVSGTPQQRADFKRTFKLSIALETK